jgi:RecA-family ATPase
MTDETEKQIVPPELISWSKFSAAIFPEESWLIKKLLPLEGFAIIASPSGEKKSWVALMMAYCIATGQNFLDHPDFAVEKSNVLYLDQEMSRRELSRRGKMLGFPSDIENLIVPESLSQIDLSDEDWHEWLNKQIILNNIQVIFVDTLRAVAGGLKEDKAEDVRQFFNKFIPYKKLGICVVFLDHCRKPHHFEGKLPKKEQLLGSQDKVASIESLLMLKSDERSSEIKVYPKKSRTGCEYKPFKILMQWEMDDQFNDIAVKLKYDGGIDEMEYKSDEARGLILDFLTDGRKSTKQIIEYLKAGNQIGASNTRRALKELETAKKVAVDHAGRENAYFLPDSAPEQDNFSETF